MANFSKLSEVLQNVKSVGISGHVRPDGDCVGSTMAVYNFIKNNYPDMAVSIFLEPIPNIFKFMNRTEEIISDFSRDYSFDLFIALDCSDISRLGEAGKYFSNAKSTVCIDHHVGTDCFADYDYIFPKASSASELVYEVLDQDKISNDIAECLYTGMVHDTGVFQYSCTSAKTMNVAGRLMEMGIDYPKIVDDTFYTKTFNQNQILGLALLKSELHLDGKVIVSVITQEEMKKYDVLPKHLDGIVNQLRVTKGVEVALFLYETEDKEFKGSLRVNGNVNVAKVASHFGGGGHIKAAGFSVSEPYDVAIPMILDVIKEQL